jgi:hypothetical protein
MTNVNGLEEFSTAAYVHSWRNSLPSGKVSGLPTYGRHGMVQAWSEVKVHLILDVVMAEEQAVSQ